MAPMKQITATDRVLQTIQTNAAAAVTDIESGPFVTGNQLSSIALTSGQDNLVPHNLGRQLLNWLLTGQDTNASVWSPNSAALGSNANTQYINLRCSSDCTVSVWVS